MSFLLARFQPAWDHLLSGVFRLWRARIAVFHGGMFKGSMNFYDDLPTSFIEVVLAAAWEMAKQTPNAFRIEPKRRSRRGGGTLRPGAETPLWNALRVQLRPHLQTYGSQAKLGRLLGLPRQRINAFVTGGGEMPDAERALQLLAWLIAVRKARPPS